MNVREATIGPDLAENPEHASEAMAQLIYSLSDAMIVAQSYANRDIKTLSDEERLALKAAKTLLRGERRKIRYRLFRIRDAIAAGRQPEPEYDSGLRAWIELQFQPGMTWVRKSHDGHAVGGFTFEWDIAYYEPLKVIKQFSWDGDVERRPMPEIINGRPTGKTVMMDVCDPAAFTQQA